MPAGKFDGNKALFVHNDCVDHKLWADDLDQINKSISNFGRKALKNNLRNRGPWEDSEAMFRGYMKLVNRRLKRVGSDLRVVMQPSAFPGTASRIPGSGIVRGTKRLDAALFDVNNPSKILSGFDISHNPGKIFDTAGYKSAFGDVPMFDIRYGNNRVGN